MSNITEADFEAQMRYLYHWTAGRSLLRSLPQVESMTMREDDNVLRDAGAIVRTKFSVEVTVGRTRRERATIEMSDPTRGWVITEEVDVPPEISEAAFAVRAEVGRIARRL